MKLRRGQQRISHSSDFLVVLCCASDSGKLVLGAIERCKHVDAFHENILLPMRTMYRILSRIISSLLTSTNAGPSELSLTDVGLEILN